RAPPAPGAADRPGPGPVGAASGAADTETGRTGRPARALSPAQAAQAGSGKTAGAGAPHPGTGALPRAVAARRGLPTVRLAGTPGGGGLPEADCRPDPAGADRRPGRAGSTDRAGPGHARGGSPAESGNQPGGRAAGGMPTAAAGSVR